MIPLAAAPADHKAGWVLLSGGALLWLAGWIIGSLIWPYGKCRRCEGEGRFKSPSEKFWRNCPRCGGTGRRVRLLAKLWRDLG